MAKQVTITMPDIVYQDYLEGLKGNRSAFIWGMMVKGIQGEQGELENNKAKITNLLKELHNNQEEIKKLNLQIASLKSKLPSAEDEQLEAATKLVKAIRASGRIGDLED